MNILSGAAWMVSFKFLDRFLGLVSTLILARLLVPADFGLVAMAMSVIIVLQRVGEFGFEAALIQKQNAEPRHFNSAWTCNLMLGMSIVALLLVLAHPTAVFYRDPRLVDVMRVLALGYFFTAFENIGTVSFRKEMRFDKEFVLLLGKRCASFICTVSAAVLLRSYWALVIGMVAGRIASLMLSYRLHPFRPRLSLDGARELFTFSKWMILNNIVFLVQARSSDFLLGRVAGAGVLGIFNISVEIGRLPTTELAAPVNRAAFPGYSRVAAHAPALHAEFLRTMGMIVMLALPAAIGLSVVAEPAVRVLLGERWLEAVPVIRIVAISGAIVVMQSNMATVFLAIGKPRTVTFLEGGLALLYLPALLWAVHLDGAVGAAWAVLGLAVVTFPVLNVVFVRMTGLAWGELLGILWRPVAGVALMVGAVRSLTLVLPGGGGFAASALVLVSSILCGAVVYAASVYTLWRLSGRPGGAEALLVDKLAALVRRARWPRTADGAP